jgi:hypothetical protein
MLTNDKYGLISMQHTIHLHRSTSQGYQEWGIKLFIWRLLALDNIACKCSYFGTKLYIHVLVLAFVSKVPVCQINGRLLHKTTLSRSMLLNSHKIDVCIHMCIWIHMMHVIYCNDFCLCYSYID